MRTTRVTSAATFAGSQESERGRCADQLPKLSNARTGDIPVERDDTAQKASTDQAPDRRQR